MAMISMVACDFNECTQTHPAATCTEWEHTEKGDYCPDHKRAVISLRLARGVDPEEFYYDVLEKLEIDGRVELL